MSRVDLMKNDDLKEISEEIFYGRKNLVAVGCEQIEFLKQKAFKNKRKRARLCVHKDTDDSLHEMIIVHVKGNYIPPHKHMGKSESFHLIEGSADIFFFDDEGKITKIVSMGSSSSGKNFYYRVPQGVYHSQIVTSDFIVFHETTEGPFDRSNTIFGSWAPQEGDEKAAKSYMDHLIGQKDRMLEKG